MLTPKSASMDCVLISGATGVVGSALVPYVLENKAAKVKLLLRANSPEHLRQRLMRLFAFWQHDQSAKDWSGRIEALSGDVSSLQWGLEDSVYRRLGQEVTHIIHAAGDVRLNKTIDEARRAAVDSARHAAALARRCMSNGQFHKLEYLSTVGVAGKTPGMIMEQPSAAASFHNTYEQAKAEAEALILEQYQAGLPVTVHRPSMVVGDSRTGKVIHYQVFYYLSDFLCGLKTCGLLPATGEAKLDIIPADYVARAIALAMQQPATAGRIFHLCTGPQNSLTLTRLSQHLRDMLLRRGRKLPPLRRLPLSVFNWSLRVLQPLAPEYLRPFLNALPFFLNYLAHEQSFDNAQFSKLLYAAGSSVPAPMDYLEQVMCPYWDSKQDEREPSRR